MAGKPKRTTLRRERATKKDSPLGIVVRRGALRRFDALKRKAAGLPVVVTWDRRQDERRTSPNNVEGERRKTDRRQKPPFTWELADFVVVLEPPKEKSRTKARTKAKAKTKSK